MSALLDRRRVELSAPDAVGEWLALTGGLLAAGVEPQAVQWAVAGREQGGLLLDAAAPVPPGEPPKLDKAFAKLLRAALLHSDPERHAIAYRLLWRMRDRPGLHRNPADADVRALDAMARQVRRDIHKMHAFVRFRKVSEGEGRERFMAWFEPEHHIERAVAGFFRNRFAGMDWAIVTPRASLAWDGAEVRFGPGGSRADVPAEDAVEAEWRGYYASIFNPARLKPQAMKNEMPVKYWRNLPEASLISPLMAEADARTRAMIKEGQMPDLFDTDAEDEATEEEHFATLDALYEAMARDAELRFEGYSDRFVRGEGDAHARIMLVGEQPGDVEDQQGRPFVGPAGEVLDHALGKAVLERPKLFVTNAVKRFKFEQRGKRRIHQTPTSAEVKHYRWWLDREVKLVGPEIVVALGRSAAEALTGGPVTISRMRGELRDWNGRRLLVTVHPSFILRLPDREAKIIEYKKFVRDLKLAA